jgi:hypothetical protein
VGEQVGGAGVIGLADLVTGGLDNGGQAPVRQGADGRSLPRIRRSFHVVSRCFA